MRHRASRVAIGAIVTGNTVVWLASATPEARLAEYLASTTVLLFAWALLLSTRARWLEPVFGGLDRMYAAHRHAALSGFTLLAGHVTLIAWRLDFRGGATPSGIIGFTGITVLVLLAGLPRLIGYRRWRWTHHLVGVFFAIAFAHTLLAGSTARSMGLAWSVLCGGYAIGITSYLYNLTLARFLRPSRRYVVQDVRPLGSSVTRIVLQPLGRPIRHRAGQFAFVRFRQRGLREPHPYTISSSAGETALTFTVKVSGDHTARLAAELRVGTRAVVEGGYGRFDHRSGSHRQVWIGGGIGITPFLSFVRDAPPSTVDLFYVVRHRHDAVCLGELSAHSGDVAVHLHVSAESGPFTLAHVAAAVPDYAQRDLYLCGPPGLIHALRRSLLTAGLADSAIHHEEFSLR